MRRRFVISVMLILMMSTVAIAMPTATAQDDGVEGRLVLVVDGQLRMLNLADNSETVLQDDVIGAVMVSPDGAGFVSLGTNGMNTVFTLYRTTDGGQVTSVEVPARYDQLIGWSPNSQWILAGTENSGVIAIRFSDGALLPGLPATSSNSVAWLENNTILVTLGQVGLPLFIFDPEQLSQEPLETLMGLPPAPSPTGVVFLDYAALYLNSQGYNVAAAPFYTHHGVLQPDYSTINIGIAAGNAVCDTWYISQNEPFDIEGPGPAFGTGGGDESDLTSLESVIIYYEVETHALTHLTQLGDDFLVVQWDRAECLAAGDLSGQLLLVDREGNTTQIGAGIRLPNPEVITATDPGGRPYTVIGEGNLIAFVQEVIEPIENAEEIPANIQSIVIYNRAELTSTTVITLERGQRISDILWLP